MVLFVDTLLLVLKTIKTTVFEMSNKTDYFCGDLDPENAYRKPPVLLQIIPKVAQVILAHLYYMYSRKDDDGE
jgi:hypothetical protein